MQPKKAAEDAVRRQMFDQTVREIKARNAGTDPDKLQAIIDEAVQEVRAGNRAARLTEVPPATGR